MDYFNENIAINLKRIRKSKKLSLDSMAVETGLSKSMLGQIERGEANPTIATLGKIISGLRVSFSDLVGPPREESYIVRRQLLAPIKEISGNYRNFVYFPFEKDRNFEIYSVEIDPNGQYVCSSHGENTMEYLIVFSGRLTVEIGEERNELGSGDAIRIDTDKDHIYCNNGEDLLRFYMVFAWK